MIPRVRSSKWSGSATVSNPKSIVLYHGPSMLDGASIVAIATIGSSNEKTGPMVQTWIMRADLLPTEASKAALDGSVCGDCPRRHSTGGDCYVTLFQAPRAVWAAWDREGRSGPNWREPALVKRLRSAAQSHGFRMGSYGDPAAVPWTVWNEVLAALAPKMHTGYTHQWRQLTQRLQRPGIATVDYNRSAAHLDWMREFVMASCDSIADAEEARALGWRFFLALAPDQVANVPARTVLCLAEREANPKTCETCGICNGTQGRETRASVYLVEHGARSQGKHKRSALAKTSQGLKVLS